MITKPTRIFLTTVLISALIHLGFSTCLNAIGGDGDELRPNIRVTLVRAPSRSVTLEPIQKQVGKQIPLEIKTTDGYTTSQDRNELVQQYLFYLREEIEKNKYQPPESRYYRLIGNTRVAFEILPDGSFAHIRILRSSGDDLLDQTALNAIHSTDGTYKRPTWSGRQKLDVSFVLKYQYGL